MAANFCHSMKVLVTGATGFVGQYLVNHLNSIGHTVYGIGRRDQNLPRLYLGDITDARFISDTVQEIRPELVFHLAGYSLVKTSFQEPELVQKTNVEGSRNVLDAMQKFVPSARLLSVSSAVVYGSPSKTPISEGDELRPSSPYAHSRVASEAVHCRYQLPWIIARSFNHTGPNQSADYVLSDWCKQVAAIELGLQPPIIKVGNLESIRDFLDVRDIVKIYVDLLLNGQSQQIYNVGSGIGYRLGDLLNTILSFISIPVQVLVDETRVRSQDTTLLIADTKKLNSVLPSYRLDYSIEQTLLDILSYWRSKLSS